MNKKIVIGLMLCLIFIVSCAPLPVPELPELPKQKGEVVVAINYPNDLKTELRCMDNGADFYNMFINITPITLINSGKKIMSLENGDTNYRFHRLPLRNVDYRFENSGNTKY